MPRKAGEMTRGVPTAKPGAPTEGAKEDFFVQDMWAMKEETRAIKEATVIQEEGYTKAIDKIMLKKNMPYYIIGGVAAVWFLTK